MVENQHFNKNHNRDDEIEVLKMVDCVVEAPKQKVDESELWPTIKNIDYYNPNLHA